MKTLKYSNVDSEPLRSGDKHPVRMHQTERRGIWETSILNVATPVDLTTTAEHDVKVN